MCCSVAYTDHKSKFRIANRIGDDNKSYTINKKLYNDRIP